MAPHRVAPLLPEPGGSLLEVSFRRLLESCIRQLQAIEATAASTAAAATAGSSTGPEDTAPTAAGGLASTSSSIGGSSVDRRASVDQRASAGGAGAPPLTGRGALGSGAAAGSSGGAADDPPASRDVSAGGSGPGGGRAAAAPGGGGGNCAGDGDQAAAVLRMRHFLDTLREQLADLRAQHEALGIEAATLDLYDTQVKAIATAVPKVQLPPYCQKLVSGGAAAAAAAATAGGGGSRTGPNMSYFTPPPARPGVTPAVGSAAGPRGGGGADAAAGRGGARAGAVAGLSDAAATRLKEAEAAQALLTDELAELTAALKANAKGMAGAVADRGKLLDVTDAALQDSLAATKNNVTAAKAQVKRSGGNLCFTCMVLLAVGLAFTAMVVYIKFTHLLGYRATAGPTAAAPPAAFAGAGQGRGYGHGGDDWRDAYGGGQWDRAGEL